MTKLLSASVLGLLGLAVAAGCSSAPPGGPQPIGSSASPIQGGTTDTTHPFAVGIAVGIGPQELAFCSGALLAPNLVATARHCAAQISSPQVDCSTATFYADYAATAFVVTTDPTITPKSKFLFVSQVITPPGTGVCGNDIALLVLSTNVNLPEYVTPIISPPMTDRSLYSTQVTVIGYGIDTPTDDAGTTAGTRRIREDVPISCIPNDTSIRNCFPTLNGVITANEFQTVGATCEGDSGSSAFDQTSFGQGAWESFGVLSRGGVSTDGKTCEGAVYTRFDAYGQFLIDAAKLAANLGNYPAPAWAGSSTSSTSSSSGSSSGAAGATSSSTTSSGGGATSSGSSTSGGAPGGNGAACTSDGDCTSNNCVTADNGRTYFCASACTASGDCPSGFACEQGYCIATASPSGGGKSGCSIASAGGPGVPGDGVAHRGFAVALAALALWSRGSRGSRSSRRSRRSRRRIAGQVSGN